MSTATVCPDVQPAEDAALSNVAMDTWSSARRRCGARPVATRWIGDDDA
jgi:hypothetical protein